MPFFKVTVYTQLGEKKELRREAQDEKDLLKGLSEEKFIPVEIREDVNPSEKLAVFSRRKRKRKFSLDEQHIFCTTLSSFMKSGLSLAEILRLLAKQTKNKKLGPVYHDLQEMVESGKSLSAAMRATGMFRDNIVGMVESGEKSATLSSILESAGDLIQNEILLKRKMTSALTYPILMLIVGLGVVVFLLSYVVPKLTELVVESGAELPLITKILIGTSKVVRAGFIPSIFLLIFVVLYLKSKKIKVTLPFLKEVDEKLTFAMIFKQTGTLLSSGISLVPALKLTEPLDPVKGRLEKIEEEIRHGYRLSQALQREGSFPEDVITIVRVGESSATLPETLIRLGNSCWDYAQSSMQKWATLAEPAIILFMGVLVGFVVISVLLPIFDLSSLAGA